MSYEQSEPFQNPDGVSARRLFSSNERTGPWWEASSGTPKTLGGLGSFENGYEGAELTGQSPVLKFGRLLLVRGGQEAM